MYGTHLFVSNSVGFNIELGTNKCVPYRLCCVPYRYKKNHIYKKKNWQKIKN